MAFDVAVVFCVCQWVFAVGFQRLALVVGLLAGVSAYCSQDLPGVRVARVARAIRFVIGIRF